MDETIETISAGAAEALSVLVVEPPVCWSRRLEGRFYIYWWDIFPVRRELITGAGAVTFARRDTGARGTVLADDLLPLLTEERRTGRVNRTEASPWGIKVLKEYPDELAVEQRGLDHRLWPRMPVRWV